MKLRVLQINFYALTVHYAVTNDAGDTLFDSNTSFPESAQTLTAIRQAILPKARALGASLRTNAQAQASLLTGIETDPLP